MISGRTTFKCKGVHLKSVILTLPDDEHVTVKGKRVEVDATHVFSCKVDGNFNAGLSRRMPPSTASRVAPSSASHSTPPTPNSARI